MSLNSTKRYFSLGIRGVRNYIFNKPFCASFEVTYNCNARCQHCHLGGMIKGEKQASAEEFARRARELKPVVAQVSGGEPLLRRDIDNIVQALRHPHRAPYIVLTTNASLLNEKKYRALKESGVDEFSISLDYPDERHDKFRGIPGLFGKIEKLCLDLRGEKNKGITLSCVVHRYNYKDMLRLAEKAYQWQVKMNFSAYTWLRTNKKDFIIPPENLPELSQMINQLQNFRLSHNTVFTSDYVFGKIVDFFREQGQEDCRAGIRFLVVNPDATLSPCGLIIRQYQDHKELKKDFVKTNTCTACFTSIRANSEKPAKFLIKDNLNSLSKQKQQ